MTFSTSTPSVFTPFWLPRKVQSKHLLRTVIFGFAAIILLLALAAWVGYHGIERIHTEAESLIRNYIVFTAPDAKLEYLIARQSRLLLDRIELVLGVCQFTAIACALLTVWTVRSAIRRMQWQADELNSLSWRMTQEHELIARRLSHEMHDEFGQSLTGLKMMLHHISPADFVRRRSECIEVLDEAIGNVRELSQLLRPVILDDFGLDEALRWVIARFQDQTQIGVEYKSDLHERLPDILETQIFRIAQEALTNMARHAEASSATVLLSCDRDQVVLLVEDNGIGFNADKPPSKHIGLGMVGMRARVRNVGGRIQIGNNLQGGASILASFPLNIELTHDE